MIHPSAELNKFKNNLGNKVDLASFRQTIALVEIMSRITKTGKAALSASGLIKYGKFYVALNILVKKYWKFKLFTFRRNHPTARCKKIHQNIVKPYGYRGYISFDTAKIYRSKDA